MRESEETQDQRDAWAKLNAWRMDPGYIGAGRKDPLVPEQPPRYVDTRETERL